jgi:hypothetical protein
MLGWSFWMLANPLLMKKFSQWSDKAAKTSLMKKVGGELEIKSREEIERLIRNPALRKRTLSNYVKISFLSLMGTILLLGIVEPYLSIKITEWQTRKQHAKRNASRLASRDCFSFHGLRTP